MGSDVTFYGHWSLNRAQQTAWRRRRVTAAALSSIKNAKGLLQGGLDSFGVGQLLSNLAKDDDVCVDADDQGLRLAGTVESLAFWEALGRELAGLVATAAKAGHEAWLIIDEDDRCFHLVSDGSTVKLRKPSAATLKRLRRGPEYALLDRLTHGLSKSAAAAVEQAAHEALHGTAVEFTATGDVEDVFAILESASEKDVKAALRKADEIPYKGTFEKPAKLFKTKDALLTAARKAKQIEQRAVAVDVASHLDPELCAQRCLPWLTKKKIPPGLRAAAARALGRSKSDAALDALVKLLYQKANHPQPQ